MATENEFSFCQLPLLTYSYKAGIGAKLGNDVFLGRRSHPIYVF